MNQALYAHMNNKRKMKKKKLFGLKSMLLYAFPELTTGPSLSYCKNLLALLLTKTRGIKP
jgi:hypothetical protein